MTVEEVAMGFTKVANEAMCRPIRALTQVINIYFNNLKNVWKKLFNDEISIFDSLLQ